jgi:hypothetical protein
MNYRNVPLNEIIHIEDLSDDIAKQYISRKLSPTHVQSLMEVETSEIPPITVANTDQGCILIDGAHRVERARRKKETEIRAKVIFVQSIDDMINQAYIANLDHGLPTKTSERVTFAVWLLLKAKEQNKPISIREAARIARVSHVAVSKRLNKNNSEEVDDAKQAKQVLQAINRVVSLFSIYGDDDRERAENWSESINNAFQEGSEEDFQKIADTLTSFTQVATAIKGALEAQI